MSIEHDFEFQNLQLLLQENKTREDISKVDVLTQTRFIRAFGSASIAYQRIVKYILWRKEFGVDNIDLNDIDIQIETNKKCVLILPHLDKLNRPVVYIAVKNHIVQNRNIDSVTKFMVYVIERACEKCIENQDQLCIIFDLNSFSIGNMDYAFVRQLIHLFSTYYPERLGICLIINSPLIFQGCWAVVKRWLSDHTVQKIIFCNSPEQISLYFEPKHLPSNN